ncbi:anti-sigma factor [Edaphobacter albus]|uniref:anti-sigma factor n=1 Tax=Edaphobacter sp. 4G125 TaxID=2763071 RepID=UPI00164584C5|nr:anti-sigma factor [Edaphobacter sp. 4G125]QNI38079.1 anti-sigma factor [Edaphobacter sp. 4G125]
MNTTFHYEAADLALFTMQLLGADEHTAVEEHLSQCAFCRQELSRVQGDLTTYTSALDPQLPAGAVRERILRRAGREKKFPTPVLVKPAVSDDTFQPADLPVEPDLTFATRRGPQDAPFTTRRQSAATADLPEPRFDNPLRTALFWMGWIAATGLGVAWFQAYRSHPVGQPSALISHHESRTDNSSDAKQIFDTLKDPAAQQVLLSSPSAEASGPAPQGRVIYSASRGVLLFFASNMPAPEAGKTYELWLIPAEGGDPMPAGTFSPDAQGNVRLVLSSLAKRSEAKAFGVTLEEGPSQSPTMPIVLAGN